MDRSILIDQLRPINNARFEHTTARLLRRLASARPAHDDWAFTTAQFRSVHRSIDSFRRYVKLYVCCFRSARIIVSLEPDRSIPIPPTFRIKWTLLRARLDRHVPPDQRQRRGLLGAPGRDLPHTRPGGVAPGPAHRPLRPAGAQAPAVAAAAATRTDRCGLGEGGRKRLRSGRCQLPRRWRSRQGARRRRRLHGLDCPTPDSCLLCTGVCGGGNCGGQRPTARAGAHGRGGRADVSLAQIDGAGGRRGQDTTSFFAAEGVRSGAAGADQSPAADGVTAGARTSLTSAIRIRLRFLVDC